MVKIIIYEKYSSPNCITLRIEKTIYSPTMASKRRKKNPSKRKSHPSITGAVLQVFREMPRKQFSFKQVSKKLADEYDKSEIYEAIQSLLGSGEIEKTDINRLLLSQKSRLKFQQVIEGVIDMTSTGNAYLISPETKHDVFISAKNLNRAFDGDRVRVALFKHKKYRDEGEVKEIIARAAREVVGTFQKGNGFGFVIPDKSHIPVDIYIPGKLIQGLKNGDRVIARITDWPKGSNNPSGEISEILGSVGVNDVEMKTILVENGFPLKFPAAVMEEVSELDTTISKAEIANRRDFRNQLTFTIDPEDARDFDDALSIRLLDNGHVEVGVHIADVSHYVRPGSAIDKEAYRRATSVYLVDRVLPMLPEQLSNIICSLRPDEDKLCFAAVFELDENGQTYNTWFGRTVIRSDRRFTYEEVQEIIENGEGDYADEIRILNEIATKLREQKFRNGAVAFETSEIQFQIDLKGVPIGVSVKERKDAHMLIEDFMLMANKAVAESIGRPKENKMPLPFVYRIHDQPDMEKLITFSTFVASLGYEMDISNKDKQAESLNALLENVRGKPQQNMIEQLAIRTMAKAVYSIHNIGHFGLAFPYYTHFTSPIRRYPDLLVHRLFADFLNNKKTASNPTILEEWCTHCSWMERKAMNAERESVKYKQVEFMQDKVGLVFDALISGVVHFGLFAEIIENKCEGLVDIDSLVEDYFVYDPGGNRLIGTETGRTLSLGDEVRVRVIKTNLERRRIDFEIILT